MRYELIYLIGASEEANIEKIKKEVEKIITDFGGQWETDEWSERRKLAYQIRKDFQGTFFAKRFNLEEKDNFQEINNQLRLLPQVSRFMISRTEDLPELNEEKRSEKNKLKNSQERKESKKKEEPSEDKVSPTKEESEVKESVPEKPKAKEEKKASDEDIDKKLEEILNI